MSEAKLQRNIIALFRKAFPQYALMLFAIENKRKTEKGYLLKAQGITSGVADLCLALPTEDYGALYLELKFAKNKQSETQKKWQQHCTENGNNYIICYDVPSAIEQIQLHINKHKLWKKQKASEQSLIK